MLIDPLLDCLIDVISESQCEWPSVRHCRRLPDERPDQGQGGAGAATLAGLKVAKELGMEAPHASGEEQ